MSPSSGGRASASLSVIESPTVDQPISELSGKHLEQTHQDDDIDFISSSHAVKNLFGIPYTTGKPVGVAIHNVGGTLLIDADIEDDESHDPSLPASWLSIQAQSSDSDDDTTKDVKAIVAASVDDSEKECEVQSQIAALVDPRHVNRTDGLHASDPNSIARCPSLQPREYLNWPFNGMKMLVASDALVYRSTEGAVSVRVEDVSRLQRALRDHQQRVDDGSFVSDAKWGQVPKLSYAEATRRKLSGNIQEKYADEVISDESLHAAQLQTCMVPQSPVNVRPMAGATTARNSLETDLAPHTSSALSVVMDAYLDNIMANVPQLALCLRDKGFIQSVKLLQTQDLPQSMMQSSTFDPTVPFEMIKPHSAEDAIFSPEIMEMNASALLRFLKANCVRDNATYLLRREAGQASIRLYDITSISNQRQKKWVWWLAMMSYRFAQRLGQISGAGIAQQRGFRQRQRSLLENTLELLEVMSDLNGGNAHESLVAAVREGLADTFLVVGDVQRSGQTRHGYESIPIDALQKASDQLSKGITVLTHMNAKSKQNKSFQCQSSSERQPTAVTVDGNDTDGEDSGSDNNGNRNIRTSANAMQILGMQNKAIDIGLRLTEHHFRTYWSSSAMQTLRQAARRIAESVVLLTAVNNTETEDVFLGHLKYQHIRLWEHCGYFARTFAADPLWRERGHSSGDDVTSVLQDVHNSLLTCKQLPIHNAAVFTEPLDCLRSATGFSEVTLANLCGVVSVTLEKTKDQAAIVGERKRATEEAARVLDNQPFLLQEERQVLVAACLSYDRALDAYCRSGITIRNMLGDDYSSQLQRRLGDACNEIGKIMLNELRRVLSLTNATAEQSAKDGAAAFGLIESAEFWFRQGLVAFQSCNDLQNEVLLQCNLCQCQKLRANSMFAPTGVGTDGKRRVSHVDLCLQRAVEHLQAAHTSLETRDTDQACWDMVSNELAATLMVLGVRRRQALVGSGELPVMMQGLRLSPGEERSIVEPLERACEVYNALGNAPQTAAAHYHLALYYNKIWTCQRGEAKTADKLQAAFSNFNRAQHILSQSLRGNELTFCLICADFSKLCSVVRTEQSLCAGLWQCTYLDQAFNESATAAAALKVKERQKWFDEMGILATTIEERVFRILRELVKVSEEETTVNTTTFYRDLYRSALMSNTTIKSASGEKNKIARTGDAQLDVIAEKLYALSRTLHILATKRSASAV